EPFAFAILGDFEADGDLQKHQNGEGCDGAIADSHAHTERLSAERVGLARGIDGGIGEHAGEQGADNAGDAVHAKSVEAVVVFAPVLEHDGPEISRRTARQTDDERASWIDETRRWRDGDKSRDCARCEAEKRWFAAVD